MGKSSSSSRKKERSKTSSSQRSKRKSRSRKLKSKKLRHRHDSPSYSDTDLEISTSVYSSSSEGDKRKGRSRSAKRKDAKKAQKRSHNGQSRDYSPHQRKRKHSKRDDDSEVKKSYKKKKRRRDVSISASRSNSLSCSTCQDGSTSSSECEIDRHRGRSGKRKRNSGKTERSRYRSKSHSPCSLCSKGSDYQIEVEDNSFVETNCRRLRSIVVVAGEHHKLEEFNGDQQLDEVIYHPDDDGASKRESNHVVSKEALKVENEKEVFVIDGRNYVDVQDHDVQNKGSNDNHGGVIDDYSSNERKNDYLPGNIESVNGTDLESILRQRALENLRRFKAVPQKIVETPSNWKVDHTNDVDVNGVEFSGQDGGSVVNLMMTKENVAKSSGAIDLGVASTHIPLYSSQNLGKISERDHGSNKLKQDCTSLDQEVLNDNIGQKADAVICSTTNRSNLVIAASRPRSKVDFHIKQASVSLESIQEKASISDVNIDDTAQILTKTTNDEDQNTGNGFGSSAPKPSSSPIPEGNNLNKSGHASEESSQFEQKTMSVMRGGEMVQVNYKVYIPKRAPALTRRQLKR